MRTIYLGLSLLLSMSSCKKNMETPTSQTASTDQRPDGTLSSDQKIITINDGTRDSALKIEASSLAAEVNFVPDNQGQSLKTALLRGDIFTSFGINSLTRQVAVGVRGMTFNEHVWSMVFLIDLKSPNEPKLLKLYRPGTKVPSENITNPFANITKIEFTLNNGLIITHKSNFGSGDMPFQEEVHFDAKGDVVKCTGTGTGTGTGTCFDEPKLSDFSRSVP